jgi:hypothetical protein
MKLLKPIVLLAAFSLLTLSSRAQLNILQDTIVWNASAYVVETADSAVRAPKASAFVSYGDSVITWTQTRIKPDGSNASKMIKLKVLTTAGTWPDLAVDGQIVFTISAPSGNGTVRFKRSGPSVVIHVELTGSQGGNLVNDFEVIDYRKK